MQLLSMPTLWLVLMVILLVIEGLIPGLVSIWFALGSMAAFFAALAGAPLWLQMVLFIGVSTVALLVTRPLARKYINTTAQPTNADMVIGKEAIVTEEINNVLGTGAVIVDGKVWTARMEDSKLTACAGQKMEVLRIEGAKLIVQHKFNVVQS